MLCTQLGYFGVLSPTLQVLQAGWYFCKPRDSDPVDTLLLHIGRCFGDTSLATHTHTNTSEIVHLREERELWLHPLPRMMDGAEPVIDYTVVKEADSPIQMGLEGRVLSCLVSILSYRRENQVCSSHKQFPIRDQN